MKSDKKISGTVEAWESKSLGADVSSAKKVSQARQEEIEQALGLQMISIRLNKELIESFKMLGQYHGIGYQPLMRDALKRFADSQMKEIVADFVQSKKALKEPIESTLMQTDSNHDKQAA